MCGTETHGPFTNHLSRFTMISMSMRHSAAEAPREKPRALDELDRLYEYARGIIARQERRIAELEQERGATGETGPEHLTAKQAALHLGISVAKLAQMRARGEGPVHTKIGRMVRYARRDLDAWAAAHRVAPGEPR